MNLAEAVRDGLAQLFEQRPASPDKRKRPGKQEPTAKEGPFNEDQRSWLEETMMGFGGVIAAQSERRFSAIEKRLGEAAAAAEVAAGGATKALELCQKIGTASSNHDARIGALEAEAQASTGRQGEVVAKIVELERAMKELKDSAAAAPSAPPVAGESTRANEAQAPTLTARCGALGWDTDKAELSKRWDEVATKAGIDPGSWDVAVPVVGRSGKGSAMEILFKHQPGLEAARLKVRRAEVVFGEGRPVWLDRKRSEQDQRMVANLHKMRDYIRDGLGAEQAQHVAVNTGRREITAAGQRLCSLHGSKVVWTTQGQAQVTGETRGLCEEIARFG